MIILSVEMQIETISGLKKKNCSLLTILTKKKKTLKNIFLLKFDWCAVQII